ncbi:hypothetical protein SteCoe_964 [Stentor coeruleus]|uniref:Uncharacterized protein n=1 Tax=Stentor coeruleus TaxID=5963 RepID=A0A1R2D2R4_9CILI|nr:hypothetical protein SteCoe_964 [Stentor coeruleus]
MGDYSRNSSLRSSDKYSNLMSFLESQDTATKLTFLDNISPDPEALGAYSEAKVKLITLKLELEEAHKTVDSLKLMLDKQKFTNEEQERVWQDKLNRELTKQQKSYEEALEKNVLFIESLLKEKEQRLKLINELQMQLNNNEENYKSQIAALHEYYKKELKKSKDAWVTTEKLKREKWQKDKAKEIKELTARGLEPEITRLVNDNRQRLEEKEQKYRGEMKALKEELETKYNDEIKRVRDNLNYKHDQMIEKEREIYSNRIKELTANQEMEIKSIRNRWNQELFDEKSKLESMYKEEIRLWQEKARNAEFQLKQQKETIEITYL